MGSNPGSFRSSRIYGFRSFLVISVRYLAGMISSVLMSDRSSWADRNGTHIRHYRKEEFDFYAVYCPEKDKVLYIPNDPKCPKAIRFEKTTNNQNLHVKWADDYLKLKRESSETIRCTPEMVKT